MKKVVTIILSLLITCLTWASKANTMKFLFKQGDGTCVYIKTFGDENFHYATTLDGVILYHSGTNYFVADINDNGDLISTNQLVHEKSERTETENNLVAQQNKEAFYSHIDKTLQKTNAKREPIIYDSSLFPHTGKPRAMVILVDFTDTIFSLNNPRQVFDKYLNATTLSAADGSVASNYGSVAQYFSDMSFGTFVPKFDIYGPVHLQHPLAYYGINEDMGHFIPDACNAIKDSVDFSQYDQDGDGNVDLVYIIYAGYSASWGQNSEECLWPKSGKIYPSSTYNGKNIRRYGICNELQAYPGAFTTAPYKRCNGIGLFCHEFSHCMGLPDLYCTLESSSATNINIIKTNQTLEYWDLMDGGEYAKNGYCPCGYSSWEREALGWMSIDTLKSSQSVTLKPVQDGGSAYRIMNDKDTSGHEYYIVENRQKRGWNKYDYGHGMLIYHVDYDEMAFNISYNSINNTLNHPRMTLIAADGQVLNYYTIGDQNSQGITITDDMYFNDMGGDPFPGTSNNRYITDTSKVAPVVYTGTYMDKSIIEINEDTLGSDTYATITFNFLYDTSGINTPITEEKERNSNKIYTIDGIYMGTDVNKLKKGIYIRNRQKIVI